MVLALIVLVIFVIGSLYMPSDQVVSVNVLKLNFIFS